MFSTTTDEKSLNKPADALIKVMTEFKASFPNGVDQLLAALPAKDIWRFMIDGQHQKQGLERCNYDREEPGYLQAMTDAFMYMVESLKNPDALNLSFIKSLHMKALWNVKNVNAHESKDDYAFNNNDIANVYIQDRLSVENIECVLIKIAKGNPLLILLSDSHTTLSSRNFRGSLLKHNNNIRKLAIEWCVKIDHIHSLNDHLESFQKIADDYFILMINNYKADIKKALGFHEKLKVIVEFVAECEQSHPYVDGNGRTFCSLLLNFLLMTNGFPPVILFNPNEFDIYETNRLMKNVIEGMSNTLELLKTKKLYHASTNDVFSQADGTTNTASILYSSYQIATKHFKPAEFKPQFWQFMADVTDIRLDFEVLSKNVRIPHDHPINISLAIIDEKLKEVREAKNKVETQPGIANEIMNLLIKQKKFIYSKLLDMNGKLFSVSAHSQSIHSLANIFDKIIRKYFIYNPPISEVKKASLII